MTDEPDFIEDDFDKSSEKAISEDDECLDSDYFNQIFEDNNVNLNEERSSSVEQINIEGDNEKLHLSVRKSSKLEIELKPIFNVSFSSSTSSENFEADCNDLFSYSSRKLNEYEQRSNKNKTPMPDPNTPVDFPREKPKITEIDEINYDFETILKELLYFKDVIIDLNENDYLPKIDKLIRMVNFKQKYEIETLKRVSDYEKVINEIKETINQGDNEQKLLETGEINDFLKKVLKKKPQKAFNNNIQINNINEYANEIHTENLELKAKLALYQKESSTDLRYRNSILSKRLHSLTKRNKEILENYELLLNENYCMEEKINNLHKDYLIIKENKLRNEIELANYQSILVKLSEEKDFINDEKKENERLAAKLKRKVTLLNEQLNENDEKYLTLKNILDWTRKQLDKSKKELSKIRA